MSTSAMGTARSRGTILLVDDDAYFRFAVATELRAAGYLVQSAENGERGLRSVEDGLEGHLAVDLIITDLVMPRMDGMRFCALLREKLQDIPILVISGNLSPSIEKELQTFGCTNFLEKPFTPSELLQRVEQLMKPEDKNGSSPSGR